MSKRIRDLDFNSILTRIIRATDVGKRKGCDYIVQGVLDRVASPTDAVRILRGYIATAAAFGIASADQLTFDQPIVEAFARMQHHPLTKGELGAIVVRKGPDVGPRLLEIAAQHPEASFDLSTVEQLLIAAIRMHGDDELDESVPPWLMHWNQASPAATALILFETLQALGDIIVPNDNVERAEYDEAQAHFERTKNIKPLKLD